MLTQPTSTQFRRLAQSSPWRWSSVEFRWTTSEAAPWRRAVVRRPGSVRVEDADGKLLTTHEASRPFDGQMRRRGDGPWLPVEGTWPTASVPTVDDDGLVVARPTDPSIDYGHGTFFENYHWVAMLDPAELAGSVHSNVIDDVSAPSVVLTDISVVDHNGRESWQATAQSTTAYDPRCSCCPLLDGHFDDSADEWVFAPPALVRLDSNTGICVYIAHQYETPRVDLDVRIEAAD